MRSTQQPSGRWSHVRMLTLRPVGVVNFDQASTVLVGGPVENDVYVAVGHLSFARAFALEPDHVGLRRADHHLQRAPPPDGLPHRLGNVVVGF
jgi:hypothetical protein